jgi:hypothetical protein
MKVSNRFIKWVNPGKFFSSAGFCVRFTNNKVFETEIGWTPRPTEWFRFCTQITRKQSQAGFCLHLTLIWVSFELLIYDRRQWDYEKNKFKKVEGVSFKYF